MFLRRNRTSSKAVFPETWYLLKNIYFKKKAACLQVFMSLPSRQMDTNQKHQKIRMPRPIKPHILAGQIGTTAQTGQSGHPDWANRTTRPKPDTSDQTDQTNWIDHIQPIDPIFLDRTQQTNQTDGRQRLNKTRQPFSTNPSPAPQSLLISNSSLRSEPPPSPPPPSAADYDATR